MFLRLVLEQTGDDSAEIQFAMTVFKDVHYPELSYRGRIFNIHLILLHLIGRQVYAYQSADRRRQPEAVPAIDEERLVGKLLLQQFLDLRVVGEEGECFGLQIHKEQSALSKYRQPVFIFLYFVDDIVGQFVRTGGAAV